nr:unnamed protein product [Digitaria exilis]
MIPDPAELRRTLLLAEPNRIRETAGIELTSGGEAEQLGLAGGTGGSGAQPETNCALAARRWGGGRAGFFSAALLGRAARRLPACCCCFVGWDGLRSRGCFAPCFFVFV